MCWKLTREPGPEHPLLDTEHLYPALVVHPLVVLAGGIGALANGALPVDGGSHQQPHPPLRSERSEITSYPSFLWFSVCRKMSECTVYCLCTIYDHKNFFFLFLYFGSILIWLPLVRGVTVLDFFRFSVSLFISLFGFGFEKTSVFRYGFCFWGQKS